MTNLIYIVPIMLVIIVVCVCYLSRVGFDHFTFKVGIGSTEFSADKGTSESKAENERVFENGRLEKEDE